MLARDGGKAEVAQRVRERRASNAMLKKVESNGKIVINFKWEVTRFYLLHFRNIVEIDGKEARLEAMLA